MPLEYMCLYEVRDLHLNEKVIEMDTFIGGKQDLNIQHLI